MKWIGKYRVLGLLGRGGFGRIYKVVRPELGRVMALKLLKPEELQETLWGLEELKRQFWQEARIMGGLDHDNIASVLDVGESEGRPFMVLEYYCLNLGLLIGEGYKLEEPSRTLVPGKALGYAEQALHGLGSLHHAGIVHRDVKPYNFMLSRSDHIRLIDFGLSKVRGELPPQRPRSAIIGSPYYSAPEQESQPDQVDARADLYGLGVLLYRLLTGRLPQQGLQELQAPPFQADAWAQFFRTALAEQPGDRFSDAWQMLDGVKELQECWQEARDAACKLPNDGLVEKSNAADDRPRSRPIRSGPVKRMPFPGLTPLAQPAFSRRSSFTRREKGVLEDAANGLEWLMDAPPLPMSWQEAGELVASLNREFGGEEAAWRVPTVEELLTLLQPRFRPEDLCLPPILGGQRRRLWSSDERTCSAAWLVDAENGAVLWQDKACRFRILPVRARRGSDG